MISEAKVSRVLLPLYRSPTVASEFVLPQRVKLNISTHMSSVVDINTKVSTSSHITHTSGGV